MFWNWVRIFVPYNDMPPESLERSIRIQDRISETSETGHQPTESLSQSCPNLGPLVRPSYRRSTFTFEQMEAAQQQKQFKCTDENKEKVLKFKFSAEYFFRNLRPYL